MESGWSKERVFWFSGLIIAIILTIFVSLDLGAGPSREVTGVVTVVGMETATVYELPKPMINVALESGKEVTVEGFRDVTVKAGDKVVLIESKKLLSRSNEYRFKRVGE